MRRSNSILTVPPDQRALIVGRTGSGKSTLARAILLPLPYVLVIDSKGEFDLPGATIISDPSKLSRISRRHEKPVIFRPSDAYANFETYNQVCAWSFARGNSTCYIDEVFDLMRGNAPAPQMVKLLKQGRSKRVRCVISTQRPRSVPISVLSESENYYQFELLLKDDRKRMSEIIGERANVNPPNKYEFWWYNVIRGGEPILAKLNVKRG